MRLGQLARKLAIPPSEISDFLTSQGMPSIEGANTRLTDVQLSTVLQRFAPEGLPEEILQNEIITTQVEQLTPTPEAPVLEAVAEHANEELDATNKELDAPEEVVNVQPESTPEIKLAEDGSTDKPEVIKAQKVALSGLKVLGKIELPEPKKKTTELPADEPTSTEIVKESPAPDNNRPAFEKRKAQPYKQERREQRPTKNPIALAREREARAAEEKKREEEKRRKEQRTLNYQKRVKAAAPTKAARLIDEDVMNMSDAELKPEPKTWFGKFWRWFTS
jgi:hypothetical protein